MRGLWILGGLVAAGVALSLVLMRESTADVDRRYEDAVRLRPAIEECLAECAEIVRAFVDRKPIERKKAELGELRRRFEALDQAARQAQGAPGAEGSEPAAATRDDRLKLLTRLENDFAQLKADADDLRARLREMKKADVEIRERVAKLGEAVTALGKAQEANADPEFNQRAGALIEEGRKFRLMAEDGLKTLSMKIVEGRPILQTALNELDDVIKRMDQLTATQKTPTPDR
jgi:chromosome segregation ATPase